MHNLKVALCLFAIIIIMIGNLRGVRESGKIFSVPAYIFIGALFLLIGVGVTKYFGTAASAFA